jgi:hypothetical protein
MIVKLIPETDEERQRYQQKGVAEIEHAGVREYMLFGNKIDSEGDLADFHEWHGSYRYLMGSLNYFYEEINDNRKGQKGGFGSPTMRLAKEPPMIKYGEVEPDITPLDISQIQDRPEGEPLPQPEVEEEGAFDEEEAQAAEENVQNISVEQLERQAEQARAQTEAQAEEEREIEPQGLKILKD